MTSQPEENDEGRVDPPANAKAVTCAQCTHVNAPGRGTCKKCGAHLFVRCNSCGARNPRIQPMCLECGKKLHRSEMARLRSRFKRVGSEKKKAVAWVFVAAVLIGVGYLAIISFANLSIPSPNGR